MTKLSFAGIQYEKENYPLACDVKYKELQIASGCGCLRCLHFPD